MILEPIKPEVLSVRTIPQLHPALAEKMGLREGHTSIGLITCTIDDCLYAALDQGTKVAEVEVIYAHSFYGGSSNPSGPFSGEIIGVYGAPDPETLQSGIAGALAYLEEETSFYSADEGGELAFFPHVLSRTGSYLSGEAGVEPGAPLAYLIAPPLEAILGLDQALKAADVELRLYWAPPSETNFAGGLLSGELTACEAAAQAFQEAVLELARRPRVIPPERLEQSLRKVEERSSAPFRLHGSGMELSRKPHGYTHLFDNHSLVPKSHPVIRLRGRLDLLSASVLEAQVVAREEGLDGLDRSLQQVLGFTRQLLATEVTGAPLSPLVVDGFTEDELHSLSHHTLEHFNVAFLLPDATMGKAVVKMNHLRAYAREVELEAVEAFQGAPDHGTPGSRQAIIHGLNRLSSVLYVLTCKILGERVDVVKSE